MTTEPPHQLDDDGNPTVETLAEDRRRRRGRWPDLSPDPSNDTETDAAVRARRERNAR